MKKISAALFALTSLLMVVSSAYAQSGCTDATIKGIYGMNFTGNQGGVPVVIVGVAALDGEGKVSATFTISLNGTVTTGAHAVGTYTVNSDCTGSATDMTDDLHYDLVILRHGAEMFLINTDSGNTFTADFKKQTGE